MAISNANHQLSLVIPSNTTTSYEGLLESQKELLSKQICELQNIVSRQCKLTGVNPLSQEMAAGALSIKIGKRPRDLLNPKAIKYMQSIFSVKDEINKKEIRAISALFGLTATQVRDFFTSQRSRVRRFIRLSREKATQSSEHAQEPDGPLSSNVNALNHPVPLNSMGPSSVEEPSCSTQDEVFPDTDDSDKYFIANIFSMMRKEETFSGQVKLMEWVLQIKDPSVLYWFLTNGGVMILASWLGQAAMEEQTSVLHVILRVLCHLPLHKALPAHMSAILQSVNKLRFYRVSGVFPLVGVRQIISFVNKAKSLLSRWSKMFARSQAMRKPNANISPVDAQNEILLKQSIGEIMENESFQSKIDNPAAIYSLLESSENSRSQPIKLLTSPSDDSNMKLLKGVSSSHGRERRKVQLVEQPGQKAAGRAPQVTRLFPTTQGRPLSADDIQKAKMRAQFMRNKYGESYVSPHVKTEVPRVMSGTSSSKAHVHPKVEEHATSSSSMVTPLVAKAHVQPKVEEHATSSSSMVTPLVAKAHVQPKVEEHKEPAKLASVNKVQEAPVKDKRIVDVEEPLWKKCKRLQISWVNPPEVKINKEWSVCYGENSKEVEVQNNRIKREKEVFYNTILEIPSNPKDPWDQEMDYDDSLTPEIPTDQLPDEEEGNMTTEPTQTELDPAVETNNAASTSMLFENNRLGPDLELLAVLLKNPQIVFALTAGQGGSLTNAQMVKLLDAMKANAASGGSVDSLVTGLVERKAEERVEVSLPSPTPSTNPVTSGWRAEGGKNQFSRQSVTVNGDAYSIPGVHFQETPPITHQRFPDLVSDQRNTFTQQTSSPAMHHQFSDMVPDQGYIPAATNLTPQANSPVTHQRFSDNRNISVGGHGPPMQGVNTASDPYFIPGQGGSHVWAGRDGLGPGPYGPAEHSTNSTNYNAYGTTREFVQPGPSWARNGGYRGEARFDSWSPEDSPVRSREYVEGWEYGEGHSRSYGYRQEMPRMQRDHHSRFRDRGGRNEGSRWRDRRR